jgi:hypothetical protein
MVKLALTNSKNYYEKFKKNLKNQLKKHYRRSVCQLHPTKWTAYKMPGLLSSGFLWSYHLYVINSYGLMRIKAFQHIDNFKKTQEVFKILKASLLIIA